MLESLSVCHAGLTEASRLGRCGGVMRMVACGCGQVFVAVRWYSWSKRVAVKFTTFDAQLYYVVCVDWVISEAVDVGVEDLKICVACWSPIGGVVV